MNKKSLFWILASLMVMASLVLSACGGGATEPPAETEEPATAAPATEAPVTEEPTEAATEAATEAPATQPGTEASFPVIPGGALEEALTRAFEGTTVTVDGAFEGNDADGVKFEQGVKAFEDATGIDVNYIGNKEFEATISVRVDAGDSPDIADFPQPGKAAQFVRDGVVVDVTTFIPEDWLVQQYNQSWRDMATIDGVEAGVFHRFNGKSLVWYPKDDFEAAGYEIPTTWDELVALSQQIADDGDSP